MENAGILQNLSLVTGDKGKESAELHLTLEFRAAAPPSPPHTHELVILTRMNDKVVCHVVTSYFLIPMITL